MTDAEDASTPLPRANDRLFGQEAAEHALSRAATEARLPHAWLFTGPEGVGKATLAYRFARFLLSGGGVPAEAEGDLLGSTPAPADLYISPESAVFRQVAAGGHANLRVISHGAEAKRGEITVEPLRALAGFFHSTAWEAGWRIAIIDAAEDMNRSAMNAVLKMLEEPPSRSIFLLVSHVPGRLLPTVRSRCRKLSLAPLGDDALGAALCHVRPDLTAESVAAATTYADGSVAQALTFLEGGGQALQERLTGLLSNLPALDAAALHAFAELAAKRDEKADNFLIAARLLRLNLGRAVRLAATESGEDSLADQIRSTPHGLDRWAELWENTSRRLTLTDSANLDRKQVLLETFFELQAAARA